MNKFMGVIVTMVLVCAICGYLFNLPQFDFFENLARISSLKFNNPVNTFTSFFTQLTSISEWGSQNIAWYEYIPKFFNYLGTLLTYPVVFIMDLAEDLVNGFRAILYFIGWPSF